jgi:energy-converting hydrogenase Eha subunit B
LNTGQRYTIGMPDKSGIQMVTTVTIQTPDYSGDLNTGHPNTGNIRIPDDFSFGMAIAIRKLDWHF